jgi:putative ABC transport system permease protein
VKIDNSQTAEIVGVVGDIRRAALTDAPRADMYFPAEMAPLTSITMFVRASGDPMSLVPAVTAALKGIERSIVVRGLQTMDAVARESVQVNRLALMLLAVFAAAALALAAVGIYAVMSYSVRQRTREIGTRLALGASPAAILWLVMRDGVKVAAIGAGLGLFAGTAAARALPAMLFSTSPFDPLTLSASVMLLLGIALLACYLPARRATRVDPVKTLVAQ